jgi:hypothetical protein
MIRSQAPSMLVRSRKNADGFDLDQPDKSPPAGEWNRTGALEPTGAHPREARLAAWEAIMREFLAAAAISAIMIGVMLAIG